MEIKLFGDKRYIVVDPTEKFIWIDRERFPACEYLNKEELKELLSFISLTLGRLNRALGIVGIDKEKEEINKRTIDNLIKDNKQLLEQRDKAHNNIVILTDKLIDLEMKFNQLDRDLVDEVKRKMEEREDRERALNEIAILKSKLDKLEEEKKCYMELKKEGINNEQ